MPGPGTSTPPHSAPATPIRVLVVDDSAFMRFTIARYLNDTGSIQVVGTARDGGEALELLTSLRPDVITLDIEMPGLDGLATLREIMARQPTPVIMLSSLTAEGAVETIQALTLGAVDFVAKPANRANVAAVLDEVATKILRVSRAAISRYVPPRVQAPSSIGTSHKPVRALNNQDRVVVIGASTGGPAALSVVLGDLPADLPAAIVIVQHMPAGFTHSLANRLDSLSPLKIKEAEPGDRLAVGLALVAPGGFHTVLTSSGEVTLNQNPPVHGVRPAIDVTLASIVQHYGKASIGVILTGMGNDGTTGATLVHAAGGTVIAEDESTCVVWGMPRSVFEADVTDIVAPLPEIAGQINRATHAILDQ